MYTFVLWKICKIQEIIKNKLPEESEKTFKSHLPKTREKIFVKWTNHFLNRQKTWAPRQRIYTSTDGKLCTWKDASHHVTKELQIKATMSYQNVEIQNTVNTKCWWGCGTTSHSLLVRMQNGTATWKTVCQFLTKLQNLPYDLAIMLFDIYSNELKTCPHKNLQLYA